MVNYWKSGTQYSGLSGIKQSNQQPPQQNSPPESNNSDANCCCPSTTKFFEDLVDKLEEMTKSLKQQFYELSTVRNNGRGLIIAEAEVKIPKVVVNQIYFIYVQRFGPPIEGKFDEALLEQLRAELEAAA